MAEIPLWQRLLGLLAYLLPWSDALSFGRELYNLFPWIAYLALPATPVLLLERSIPFGGFLLFLVLFLFYLGYMALWSAIENDDTAADLTSILCLVGSVFAILSRYAVLFWNQGLHQGASLSMDAAENVADVFWYPALVCIAGFVLLFVALVFLRTQTEIRARRARALLARERQS